MWYERVNTRLWDVAFLLRAKGFSDCFHGMFIEVKPKEEINKEDSEVWKHWFKRFVYWKISLNLESMHCEFPKLFNSAHFCS